ncbi:DUF58 domain-containing protein [Corallincola platygyrae]|uniref:DUF58 domain-containing protein n=1 Tax=Corallincola platygyrae TaxID=1193278 RepID=A0ABW4XR17_9GAMM
MLTSIRRRMTPMWERWLARRIPQQEMVTLGQGNVFIFPSRFGFAFLFTILSVYLLGTNYSNNLALFLAFFLVSVFVGSIWFSYRNLAGLQISCESTEKGYQGDDGVFRIRFVGIQPHIMIQARFKRGSRSFASIERPGKIRLTVKAKLLERGLFSPGRLTVESVYPLGLFRTWTHLDTGAKTLVYPKPMPCQLLLQGHTIGQEQEGGDQSRARGNEEFESLRSYQQGESLRQVAWKQYAQGRGMMTKQFDQPEQEECWLVLLRTPGKGLEERLSRLCFRVLELSQQGTYFGLELGSERVSPGSGEKHKLACLKALALFGKESRLEGGKGDSDD